MEVTFHLVVVGRALKRNKGSCDCEQVRAVFVNVRFQNDGTLTFCKNGKVKFGLF
jgi:hypothetical protein